jgi:tetratricopeptide (TPR) repeat protein
LRIDWSDIYSKVRLYLSVGRFEAAEKVLMNALDEFGSMSNIHNLLGVTYHRQSKFVDAIEQFTKALKINNSFIEAGLNLAATFCDLGKYDDARAVFNDIIAKTPPNKKQPDLVMGRLANYHASSGKLYEQCGLVNEALAEYRKALTLYEKLPDVNLAVGKIYFKQGQIEKALHEFQTITNQLPDEADAQMWIGICHWKLQQFDQARRHWQLAHNLKGGTGPSSAYLKLSQESKHSPTILKG